jgi:hypothetical protein
MDADNPDRLCRFAHDKERSSPEKSPPHPEEPALLASVEPKSPPTGATLRTHRQGEKTEESVTTW